jgi:alpha-L-rhamnosidase
MLRTCISPQSFNHYALGAVASFMHKYIGGISIEQPGWRQFRIEPKVGGSVKAAKVGHLSPYGRIGCEWKVIDAENGEGQLQVKVEVPPNTTAVLALPGRKEEIIGSGHRNYVVAWRKDEAWPPKAISLVFGQPPADGSA